MEYPVGGIRFLWGRSFEFSATCAIFVYTKQYGVLSLAASFGGKRKVRAT